MSTKKESSNNRHRENSIDAIRGLEFRSPEEFAQFLTEQGVCFTPNELIVSSLLLNTRICDGGQSYLPEWLARCFTSLSKGISAKTICDPWAGIGILIAALQEATEAQEATAITKSVSNATLGRVLVPQAKWLVGDPLHLVGESPSELDLVASVLPMNVKATHPLKVSLASGQDIEVVDDLGGLMMTAASLRLSAAGLGLFVVTPSFFFRPQSVFHQLGGLGLGLHAALALPSGTFAPYTNIPTYLVVVRRQPSSRMFVAKLSSDPNTNRQVISNFRLGTEGGSLELGRIVACESFRGLDQLRFAEALEAAEKRFGFSSTNLQDLGDVKSGIALGRTQADFAFEALENAIYIPLIGNSDVVESPDRFTLKPQNYAQVAIDPSKSDARFVMQFLNSEIGKELRGLAKTGTVIPKLNKQSLRGLRVLVPDLPTQQKMLEVEARITAEHNTIRALQNEIFELRRNLWSDPKSTVRVAERVTDLGKRLAGGVKQHVEASLDQWFETQPFPLASILRAWQATPSQDFKTKYDHLLHFFEGAAEFVSVVLLSAFSSNDAVFAVHRRKLTEIMRKQNLSFDRATFGVWKLVVEYFGKQTRDLLREEGKAPDAAKNDRSVCADMFADPSLSLATALSQKELAAVFSRTNKMRNDWGGHGGVVGQEEAAARNEQLLAEVQKLRETVSDLWAETQLIHALHCRPRSGVFENEVAVLMGSNTSFLHETRPMATWLDVERLYLSGKGSLRALKLLPLIQVGASPQSAKNACYFFSRLERDGARFVSYHFFDKPELTGQFSDATEAIKLLSENT